MMRGKVLNLLERYSQHYNETTNKDCEYELGIDEAGRGPVFGSMVYAALWWPIALKEQLSKLGFYDSKALSEEERENLHSLLQLMRGKLIFYSTKELTGEYICTNMQSDKHNVNLNQMSHCAALELLQGALDQGFKISHVYVDTVGDAGKYRLFFINNLHAKGNPIDKIVVQPKADRDHKVVSAASICAKVQRDRILKQWKFRQNIKYEGELGSGYPSDPKTKKWLEENKDPVFGYPNLIRFSWSTVTVALNNFLQLRMTEPEEEAAFSGLGYYFRNRVKMRKSLDTIVPL